LPTKFDILQSYNAELYQSLKLGRFGQRQMGSSADDDDDDNRDYEGEHMRLVKHTPSAQEQSERYTRDTMDKLNNSIVDLDDDVKVLINEVKELKEVIKNIRGILWKSE
jgi:hypothetical protein